MIVIETVTKFGTNFRHTYSSEGYEIERDGIRYAEAYDPIDTNREYTETDTPAYIDDEDATTEDYEEALNELGVSE